MSKIIALDPSKNCTGFVLYDLETQEIVETGTFDAGENKKDYKRRTDQKQKESQNFGNHLMDLFMEYGFSLIVTEYPHGSKSSVASWALSMVNSCIMTFSLCILGKKPVCYLESDAKVGFFNRRKVSKEQTRKAMHKLYPEYKPALWNKKVVKYKDEAICDALLILTKYLNDADISIQA